MKEMRHALMNKELKGRTGHLFLDKGGRGGELTGLENVGNFLGFLNF